MSAFKTDDETLRTIVPGATIVKSQTKDDYVEEAGGSYDNGLSFNVWDRRFNAISADIAAISWLVEIPIDRHIWKTIGIFNTRTGILYLVTSYNNFLAIQRKIKKGNHSHYMYLLTITNGNFNKQLSFDGLGNDDVEEKRLKEAEKMLGDDFARIKRTDIITYEYFEDAAVNGMEIIVDNNFNIVDKLSIPEYQTPGPDEGTPKYDNQGDKKDTQKSDSIVKWNANKAKRLITSEENNNGTSN